MHKGDTHHANGLLSLPRSAKKTLAVMADSALCVLTVWLSICLRFESWVSLSGYQWLAVILSVALAIPLLTAFGFYHTVIRFVGRQTVNVALRAIGVYAVIYSAIFTAFGFPLVPRTLGILQPLLLLIGLALLRLTASQLLKEQSTIIPIKELPGVLIYGAGNSGQQLAASLQAKQECQVVGFLDDNSSLQDAKIAGIPVYSPAKLSELNAKVNIRDILLAMPSISRSRRTAIIKQIGQLRIAIRTLPSLTDLAQGKVKENDLRELSIEDLLGRDPVAPITELLELTITGKVIVVTGAGGSIGGELCRQIIKLKPSKLLLLELNEFALYSIHQEICSENVHEKIIILPILANVLDSNLLHKLFNQYKPDTVFHAAAYKHVPLVETNSAAGLRNNILGTIRVAQAAIQSSVSDMVLISTDKAVRPTNVMGASKRLAEIGLHSLSQKTSNTPSRTRFCIVRFGNVLGSSGSVVPLFREQIKRGGPLTLTHPDITRYFMTIPEAAQLVLQAAGLNAEKTRTGCIYLLDMGDSVRIYDMAVAMIQLSGLRLRDSEHADGDIEIRMTGLRPGEKLYEELLVSGDSQPTRHSKILCADDELADSKFHTVASLTDFCEDLGDDAHITMQLIEFNIGYTPKPAP